jgi:hypothetical protein
MVFVAWLPVTLAAEIADTSFTAPLKLGQRPDGSMSSISLDGLITPTTGSTYGAVQYLGCYNDTRVAKDDVSRSVFERDKVPYWTNYGFYTGEYGGQAINSACDFSSYDEGSQCQWVDPRLQFLKYGARFSQNAKTVS